MTEGEYEESTSESSTLLLLVKGVVVAKGKVHAFTSHHHAPVPAGASVVSIDTIVDGSAKLHFEETEIENVEQARGAFVMWPSTDIVTEREYEESTRGTPEKQIKKINWQVPAEDGSPPANSAEEVVSEFVNRDDFIEHPCKLMHDCCD